MIDVAQGTAMLFGRGDEPFDLTTVDDTARFTPPTWPPTPPTSPGVRYISGSRSTFGEIFDETEKISGKELTRNTVASAEDLKHLTASADDPWSVVPQWYMLAMLTTPPFPRDDDHYPGAPATTLARLPRRCPRSPGRRVSGSVVLAGGYRRPRRPDRRRPGRPGCAGARPGPRRIRGPGPRALEGPRCRPGRGRSCPRRRPGPPPCRAPRAWSPR